MLQLVKERQLVILSIYTDKSDKRLKLDVEIIGLSRMYLEILD
jgi:hypothetical protein